MLVLLLCLILIKIEFIISESNIKVPESGCEDKNNIIEQMNDVILSHKGFDLFFHYDESNWNLVDKIAANVNDLTIKSINLLYYNNENITENLLQRPLVYKVLNVIVLNDVTSFATFLNKKANVNDQDEALFVVPSTEANLTFLTSDMRVKIFGKILIIDFDSSSIHTICYYCGEKSGKIEKIIDDQLNMDRKEFGNFHAQSFKVGFTEFYSFIVCKQFDTVTIDNSTTMKICTNYTGSECDLIALMGQRLNFKFVLIWYSTYPHMMGDLEQGNLDFIIGGITATSKRAKTTTFTRQYWFEGFYFLNVVGVDLKRELRRVLDPFDGHLWLLFGTTIFVIAVVLCSLDRIESGETRRITCSESLMVCLYMAIEQNVKIKQVFKIRPGPAILLMAWMLVCLNISTAYKSKLASIVMNPPNKEPSNLAELVENNYKLVVNEKYQDVFGALLINTTDPIVQIALKRTEIKDNICEEFTYAVENHAAILDEYTALQYELRKSCKRELKKFNVKTQGRTGTNIRIAKTPLRVIGQVWLLQSRAAYRSGFDKMLGRIVDAGLIAMWRTTYTRKMTRGIFPESHNYNQNHDLAPISLRLLMSLFLVYMIGNSCGLIIFVIERFYHPKSCLSGQRKWSRYKL